MDVRRRVGLNVKNVRRERGLSQEGLAFECGLHRTYVSGVERGIRNPTVVVLEKIAEALEVPAGRLLDEPLEAEGQIAGQPSREFEGCISFGPGLCPQRSSGIWPGLAPTQTEMRRAGTIQDPRA